MLLCIRTLDSSITHIGDVGVYCIVVSVLGRDWGAQRREWWAGTAGTTHIDCGAVWVGVLADGPPPMLSHIPVVQGDVNLRLDGQRCLLVITSMTINYYLLTSPPRTHNQSIVVVVQCAVVYFREVSNHHAPICVETYWYVVVQERWMEPHNVL